MDKRKGRVNDDKICRQRIFSRVSWISSFSAIKFSSNLLLSLRRI